MNKSVSNFLWNFSLGLFRLFNVIICFCLCFSLYLFLIFFYFFNSIILLYCSLHFCFLFFNCWLLFVSIDFFHEFCLPFSFFLFLFIKLINHFFLIFSFLLLMIRLCISKVTIKLVFAFTALYVILFILLIGSI